MGKERKFYIPEGYRPFDENISVLRLAPGAETITFEWNDFSENEIKSKSQYSVFFKREGDRTFNVTYPISTDTRSYTFGGFKTGATYCLYIIRKIGDDIKYSLARRFVPGETPGVVVNYIHPNDRTYISVGCSPASPSIVKLPSGRILVSHDIYERCGESNLSKVFRSDDNGASFYYLTDLCPCFWGKLFWHDGAVYMLACTGCSLDLIISRSLDEGETWSEPAHIIRSDEKFGVHKAPVPVIFKNGRLFTAVEIKYKNGERSSAIVSADLSGDLTDPANYTVSGPAIVQSGWPGLRAEPENTVIREGNAVVTPDGGISTILRYNVHNPMNSGYAMMFDFDLEHPEKAQTYNSVIGFIGGHAKFSILHNRDRNCYYSLVNRATLENPVCAQRNILSLVKSADLKNWELVYDVFNYQDNGWHEDYTKTAFQYVDFIFDGENGAQDKILAVSRTALNGARSYHDNNYVTFHEISLDKK